MIPLTKKWRVERRWKSKLKALLEEDTFYDKKFDELNLRYLSAEDISCRLRAKNISISKKGELNILAVFKHHNWEKFSLIPALKKFGNVHHFDWSDRIVDIRNVSQKLKINELLVKYFENLHEMQKIDLIFGYFSGESIEESTLIYFKEKGIPIINLSLNDRELFVGRIRNGKAQGIRDICKHVSISWTSTESAVKKILVEGGNPIYMPEGANPEIHKSYPNEKKVYPVSFVGACYGDRPKIIQELKGQGIDVHTFGRGWPNGEVPTKEIAKIYSMSMINLGFSGVGNLDGVHCLKGRDFEVLMSKAFYLTEHSKELENHFDIGNELVSWSSVDELITKIKQYIDNPKEIHLIAQNGRNAVFPSCTWENRIRKIIALFKTENHS